MTRVDLERVFLSDFRKTIVVSVVFQIFFTVLTVILRLRVWALEKFSHAASWTARFSAMAFR